MPFETVIEPFRIKTIETIKHSWRHDRENLLKEAGYNLFKLKSEDVLIDFLTDSGTTAMSCEQWAGMMKGDESYAGGKSFYHFEKVVKEITNFKHILPTHQGRAAEKILFEVVLKPGSVVPNNTHFDTTRGHIMVHKGSPLDLPVAEKFKIQEYHPFKGNIDLNALKDLLSDQKSNVPLVMITLTENSGGGQPVSMANLRAASEICRCYGVKLIYDACRFAENSWFIKTREEGYADKTPLEIAQEMFSYADGCIVSAKKDGMASMGGFLAMNDDSLAQKCKSLLILHEGFLTYGGLAGYDLESIAIGLMEALNEDYLRYRIGQVKYLGDKLIDAGVPIVQPTGGHAVYIDAKAMLPHIPQLHYPALALCLVLYLEGGIRTAEFGSAAYAKKDKDGNEIPCSMELVRLSIPRRAYTKSHIDYVVEVMQHVNELRTRIRGVKVINPPKMLRHFTANFEPVYKDLIVDESSEENEPDLNESELRKNFSVLNFDYKKLQDEHSLLLEKVAHLEKSVQDDTQNHLNAKVATLEKLIQKLIMEK